MTSRDMDHVLPHSALEKKVSISQSRLERRWLAGLLLVLVGYCLLGRTAAYFFIGELEMIAGLLIYFRGYSPLKPLRSSTMVLLLCFMGLGLAQTIPYLSTYGMDAIRDAFLWGYGAFAIILSTLLKEEDISSFFVRLRRFAYWGVPAVFVSAMIERIGGASGALPHLPWAPSINIPAVKLGDSGVYLCGFIAMLLLFPQRKGSVRVSPHKTAIFYLFLILMILLCAASGRAGLLGAVIPVIICLVFRPGTTIVRVAIVGALCIVLGGGVFASGILQSEDNQGRAFSATQIEANALSLFTSDSSNTNLEGTKEWRLNWWLSIADATILGPRFWTGYGFGVNLTLLPGAPEEGSDFSSLRSPHNGSVDVLGRMGVPGLILWVALLTSFAVRLLHAQSVAYKMGARFWANVFLWIFCVWFASFTESLSDVYLEGPMGGILFWSAVGFGEGSIRLFSEWRKRNIQSVSALDTDGRHLNKKRVKRTPRSKPFLPE